MLLGRSSLVLLLLTLSFGTPVRDQAAGKPSLDALLKERVDSGKGVGIVTAILEADGSSTVAAYGKSGPDALPLDADSVFDACAGAHLVLVLTEWQQFCEIDPDRLASVVATPISSSSWSAT